MLGLRLACGADELVFGSLDAGSAGGWTLNANLLIIEKINSVPWIALCALCRV